MSADTALLEALLHTLADTPGGVSLPRLCKRLGLRMSVLLRMLAYLGEDMIGGTQGLGWVRTVDDGARTLAHLTDAGRQALERGDG
ncbi:hypothetical protein [Luteimonas sp. gir]|uniref:hypothetical protein n=1 Tax=Luteimonas sp. gir TaxID=3127960 RepID=UPI003075B39C